MQFLFPCELLTCLYVYQKNGDIEFFFIWLLRLQCKSLDINTKKYICCNTHFAKKWHFLIHVVLIILILLLQMHTYFKVIYSICDTVSDISNKNKCQNNAYLMMYWRCCYVVYIFYDISHNKLIRICLKSGCLVFSYFEMW